MLTHLAWTVYVKSLKFYSGFLRTAHFLRGGKCEDGIKSIIPRIYSLFISLVQLDPESIEINMPILYLKIKHACSAFKMADWVLKSSCTMD